MLTDIKRRLDREDEDGFTLIELMVVVLIIAILLAIAIPTFLGARGQANSRAVESSLRNALTAEQTYFTNNQQFGDTTTTPTINSIEPNLTWLSANGTSEDPNGIFVDVAEVTSPSDSVYLQAYGKDGNCYTLFQSNGTVPSTSSGTGYAIYKGACTSPGASASTPLGTYPTVTAGQASSHIGTAAPAAFYTSW